jgi:hypothetical protein
MKYNDFLNVKPVFCLFFTNLCIRAERFYRGGYSKVNKKNKALLQIILGSEASTIMFPFSCLPVPFHGAAT